MTDLLPPADAVASLCASVGSTADNVNHADLMLYRHCREGRNSTPALQFANSTLTYGEVAELSARSAAMLSSRGVAPGDSVILSLPDCPVLAAAYFGVVAAGGIAIVIDPTLSSEDAFYIAQLCGARLAIVDEPLLDRWQGLGSASGMVAVMGAGHTWDSPSALTTDVRGTRPDYRVHGNSGGHAYGVLSSGSTGRPKLIVHRHRDILYGYFAFARAILHLGAADRVISVAKMSTGYGLGSSILMPFLAGASTALVNQGRGISEVFVSITDYRCTLLFAQPRFLAEAVSRTDVSASFSNLRLAVTGGEPLAASLSARWRSLSEAELLDSYGSTEVGFLFMSNRPGDRKTQSVGRPVAGLEVEVLGGDGNPVVPEEFGTLRVRGPMVIDGYWNDPVRSEPSFHDGWFVTSDIFSIDHDGYYYIHGRSDHLIKLGCGDWVNPAELEMVLLEHPSVRECAIAGSGDSRGLTVLLASVVSDVAPAATETLAAELADMICRRWPAQDYKRLDAIAFVPQLPKTSAGKLDRAKLRPQSMTEFSYKC